MQPNRLPDIYLFNPTCEYAVANGHVSWQPNDLLKKMEEDLCTLPLFLAGSKDIILVRKTPSENFLESLRNIRINLPHFQSISDALNTDKTTVQSLGKLIPWGWSPATHHLLEPLKKYCSAEFHKSPVSKWNPDLRELCSKKFAAEILKSILPYLPSNITMDTSSIPEICTTRDDIKAALDKWGKIMIKAPWSSSGRGLQPISKTPVVPKVWEKIMGIINQQGYAIAEPLLNKKLDLSLQFELRKGKVNYLGTSLFYSDKKGQYQGNFLNGWPDNYDPESTSFAGDISKIVNPPLIQAIERSPLVRLYEGFFGVDTIIFRNREGQLRINPCLEINVRQNMGLLSLNLKKFVFPYKKGVLNLYYHKEKSFLNFINEMQTNHPPKLTNNFIESGFFPLTDADEKTLFGAYIFV